MAKLDPPEKFSFKANEWEEWIEEFDRYRHATRLHKEDGEIQRDTLIYVMGGKQANKIFKSLKFLEGEKDTDYDLLVKKFTGYFIPKRNIIHERSLFQERGQGKDESVEEFVRDLQSRVQHCNYHDPDDQVRDRFVIGLQDSTVKQKLQLIEDLTLEKAVIIARQHEQVKQQLAQQQSQHQEVNEARAQASKGRGKPKAYYKKGSKPTEHGKQCQYCGYEQHRSGGKCPASGKTCMKCRKKGHFAKVCRSKCPKQEKQDKQGSTDEVSTNNTHKTGYFLGLVDNGREEDAWCVPLLLGGSTVNFKIDTGADISIMSLPTWESLKERPALKPTSVQLVSPGGKPECCGEFLATTHRRNTEFKFKVIVIKGPKRISLLARSIAAKMGLVKLIDETSDELSREIGRMDTEPVKIQLKDGAVPYCVTTARRVPFPMMDAVKCELQRMLKSEVIREVTEPTDWCAPMVPVPKPNGTLRICVDLKQLNKAVRREHYMLPSLEDIAPKLKDSKLFSKLDAASGFWQIPLEEDSQLLTTFMTPFGRYAFRRIPFGITSAPEIFQRKMSVLLQNLEGTEVIMDDILVHGSTQEEHDERLAKVLAVIKKSGLRLNKEKCEFQKSELSYFGHVISSSGIKADPEKVKAMIQLDRPENIGELRTVIGMFQYLGRFINDMSSVMKPMTDLLRSDTVWIWGASQEAAFEKTKTLLSSTPTLVYYDPKKPTVVSADASSYGLGAVLLQTHGKELKPVAFCSRTLTETERRYAQIEKECLAGVWACERFARYLVGLKEFNLLTDHKPLVPLLNSRDIDKTPVRCQRLILRLMRFNAYVQYVPGKQQVVADAFSRKPTCDTDDTELAHDVEAYVDAIQSGWPASPGKLTEIRRATEEDEVLRSVADFVIAGWPKREEAVPHTLKPYYQVRAELSISDGILIYGNRIVIPVGMQGEMLNRLHESHQHISKTRERATMAIWWPHISRDIKTMVENCAVCRETRPTQREQPLRPIALPDRPWAQLGADLFEYKRKMYLVVIDYFSRWIEVKQLTSTSCAAVVTKLRALFTTFGIPDVLISDNGPQFSAQEFGDFAKAWGFRHHTTNPYRPQENGMAERAVRTAKELLKLPDPEVGLLNYRATPHSATGVTPAVALMGRQLQTRLPVLPSQLKPQIPDEDKIRKSDQAAKESYKAYYDSRHGVKTLPALTPEQSVLLKLDTEKKWSTPAKVLGPSPDNRSYQVQTENRTFRRNRKHLQSVPTTMQFTQPEEDATLTQSTHGSPESSPCSPATTTTQPVHIPVQGTPARMTSSGRTVRVPHRYRE